MVELRAEHPFDTLLPVRIGAATLSADQDLGHVTLLISKNGSNKALGAALKAHYGLAWPAAGRSLGTDGAEILWYARNQALLIGPPPKDDLAPFAALIDQSDGLVRAQLQGPGVCDVLARLVPVDLRITAFPLGQTLRSLAFHIPVCLSRVSEETISILVTRSMAGSLVHDLINAMEAVHSRG